jgi:two-component system sensor histidine kinase RegB
MFSLPYNPQTVTYRNLRRLFWLRFVMIGFLTLTTILLVQIGIPLPARPIAGVIGAMLLLNLLTWWRLSSSPQVSEAELFIQLLGDIATLTILFYLTGGYNNPLVWMYLLPLAIASVALRNRYVWLIAILVIACYSALVFVYLPLSHLHIHTTPDSRLDIHLAGMWLGFVVSACILAFFVSRIGQNLREYDRMVADAREKALESERILALGSLATAAAHELGTPLATMAVLTHEMLAEKSTPVELHEDLKLLRKQVDHCKEILTSLTANVGETRAIDSKGIALDSFLEKTISHWHDHHPAITLTYSFDGDIPSPMIVADRTLGMALTNLIDNSADASPDRIEIHGTWKNNLLILHIRDFGSGLSPLIAGQVGTPFFSTKKSPDKGMGLGLYLARMILARFDGSVTLNNHPAGGTDTCIRLPLDKLMLPDSTIP